MTTWIKDERGNKCSVEWFGTQDAAQAALDSLKDCDNCVNCSGCSGCSRCSDCRNIAWLDNKEKLVADPSAASADVGPTQKPIDLMAWLIRSYTARGETVLDFAAGSGTTAIAALREGRRYICIEKFPEFFEMAESRIAAERGVGTLLEAAQ